MQLVGAQGEAARRAALRQMRGGVASFVEGAVRAASRTCSAAYRRRWTFPRKWTRPPWPRRCARNLRNWPVKSSKRADPKRARMLREGASVVLCGRPNVGKSSLMNALLSAERAIVTDIPGTTRDVLSERFTLGGKVVRLSDTAGIRASGDAIERMGVERARSEVEAADVALLVLDMSQPVDRRGQGAAGEGRTSAISCVSTSVICPRRWMRRRCRRIFRRCACARARARAWRRLLARLEERLGAGGGEEECFTVERQLRLAREGGGHAARLRAGAGRRVQPRRGGSGHAQGLRDFWTMSPAGTPPKRSSPPSSPTSASASDRSAVGQ